jgi:hypothetical protein
MSSCLTWLPADLLHLLEDFLTTKDFLSLLHTNQILRREYHHLRYISLDRKHSRMYAEDEEFRVRVQSVIGNPCKQLAVDLSRCNMQLLGE